VGEVPPAAFNDILRDIERDAQNHTQKALDRVQQAGIQGDSAIVEGLPFQAIIDIAKDKNVDLIVMGTHGRTGLIHVLMGSVAEKVVRLAPCSVLVTRGKIEDEET
jgi:nucleotide-binding universal stress UspA family protein